MFSTCTYKKIHFEPCHFSDPLTTNNQKALEAIGANLQRQYERWQPKARYKQSLDPTAEEVKKLCTSLRRNAKVRSANKQLISEGTR